MKLFSYIEKAIRSLLPSPFTIAILLTVVTLFLAFFLTDSNKEGWDRGMELLSFWEKGLWKETGLGLAFMVQMMLMLVLGHVLALTKPVDNFISYVTQFCASTAKAAAIVTFLTVLVALFNWGLGLIFGAILARKVGEHAARAGFALNYGLIGAAGYSGLMVWHGGISGSAPIKAAEYGNIKTMMGEVVDQKALEGFPSSIDFSQTVFGSMNLTVMLALIVVLPLFMYFMGQRTSKTTSIQYLLNNNREASNQEDELVQGAEKLDRSKIFSLSIGLLISAYVLHMAITGFGAKGLGFITPNFINLLLLGLCLSIHKSISEFLKAVNVAIGGASGILIQFPLYFGIIGIMTHSGLIDNFSNFFVEVSNEITFPIYTFFSAGMVNVFVPSGGGQWAVQGPIVLQAASDLGVSTPKAIMALSYGDQLTNMLQPFWALPLLGITGLKAKTILPYTVALMMVGIVIFILALLVF